jgi:hypothetical protein
MDDEMTEIGIEKFRVAFTDNGSVMVKTLICSPKYSHVAFLYVRSTHIASDNW